MDQTQFNHDVAAIVALLVTLLGGIAAFVGLPAFVTPELITQVATAITAAASIYFYIRGRNAANAAPAA